MAQESKNYDDYLQYAKSPYAFLENVPPQYITKELCITLLRDKRGDTNKERIIALVSEILDADLIYALMCYYGLSLKDYLEYNDDFVTALKRYIKIHGSRLRYLRSVDITLEDCHNAVENDALSSYRFIPDRFLTEDLCITLMRRVPNVFCTLPAKCKTKNVILAAVLADPKMIYHVKKEHKTMELCKFVLDFNPHFLPLLRLNSPELYWYAVRADPTCIKYVGDTDPLTPEERAEIEANIHMAADVGRMRELYGGVNLRPPKIIMDDVVFILHGLNNGYFG